MIPQWTADEQNPTSFSFPLDLTAGTCRNLPRTYLAPSRTPTLEPSGTYRPGGLPLFQVQFLDLQVSATAAGHIDRPHEAVVTNATTVIKVMARHDRSGFAAQRSFTPLQLRSVCIDRDVTMNVNSGRG